MQNEVTIEEEEGEMENKIESNTFGTQVQSAAVLHDRSQHFSSSALIFAYIDKEPYTALEGQHMIMSEGIKVTYF